MRRRLIAALVKNSPAMPMLRGSHRQTITTENFVTQ